LFCFVPLSVPSADLRITSPRSGRDVAVGLATAKYFKDGVSSSLHLNVQSGWLEICKGLGLVAHGYGVLVLGGLLGPVLIWLSLDTDLLRGQWNRTGEERDTLLLLGMITIGATALVSYGLVLAGQWRCLRYAPEKHNAKQVMYVCVHAVFLALALNAIGAWLDGGGTYKALQGGWDDVARLDPHNPCNLIQAASAGVGLFASLVFSLFLRSLAGCVNDRVGVRSVDLSLALVGLLLGGSLGTAFWLNRLALRAEMLPWLVGGWLLCFAWHLALVRCVRDRVEDALCRPSLSRGIPAPKSGPGGVGGHSNSGLRRLPQKQAGG
jgi:hypothetical protein